MQIVCWRIEPLETPAWLAACARCGRLRPHVSVDRFRVNSRGRRHDVWLLYRCAACGATRKRRIAQRVASDEIGAERLAAYRADDPLLALAHAFEVTPHVALAYRLGGCGVAGAGPLLVRIQQPLFCNVRWDRLLAVALGLSRARVARAWRDARIVVAGVRRPSAPVRDGHELRLAEGLAPPRGVSG